MAAPVRNRSEALGRLADLAPHLLSRGVTSLRVFGSAGRDAVTDESDVDILVEFDRPVGRSSSSISRTNWRGCWVAPSIW